MSNNLKKNSKIIIILIYFISISIVSSSKSNFKALLNIKQDQENLCFYGSLSTILQILSDTILVFEDSSSKVNFKDYDQIKKMVESLSLFKYQLVKDELSESDLNDFISLFDSLIAEISIENIKERVFIGAFHNIFLDIEEYFRVKYSSFPFYTPRELTLILKYSFNLKYLQLLYDVDKDKDKCIHQSDLIDLNTINDNINQDSLMLKPNKSDTIVFSQSLLSKRFAIGFWFQVEQKKVDETKSKKVVLLNISNIVKDNAYFIEMSIVRNNDKSLYFHSNIYGNINEIQLTANCDEMIFVTFAIEISYNEYIVNVSLREYLSNHRSFYSTRLPKISIEGGVLRLSNHVKQSNTVIVDFIRCSTEAIVSQKLELNLLLQFIPIEVQKELTFLIEKCNVPECDVADKNGECYICPEEKYIEEGLCKDTCSEGYYLSTNSLKSNICLPCTKCKTCINENTCTSCTDQEYLVNKECKVKCPDSTFPVKKANGDNTCEQCDDDCLFCSSKGKCEKCNVKFLYEEKCIEDCPNGYFQSFNPNHCLPCIDNCLDCNSLVICKECNEGYYLDDNGRCVSSCRNGKFPNDKLKTCEECEVNNCKVCRDSNECIECNEGYSLSKDNKTCISFCEKGYVQLETGACAPCIPNCEVCPSYDRSICNKCDSLHVMSIDGKCIEICNESEVEVNKTCKKCPDNCIVCNDEYSCKECDENYKKMPNSLCVKTCPNGYFQSDRECVPCITNDNNCLTCNGVNNGECNVCNDGFVIEDGKCKSECELHSYVDEKNVCHQCKEDCVLCNKYGCIECKEGYEVIEGRCIKECNEDSEVCSPCNGKTDCESCLKETRICEKCVFPMLLLSGECVDRCPYEYYEYIDDDKNKHCLPCSNEIDNCLICPSNDKCMKCNEGYFLDKVNGRCIEECDKGFYMNIDKCEVCSNNCLDCTSKSNCIDCKKGFLLNKGGCFEKCDANQFENESGTCENCSSSCATCALKPGNCLSCLENMYLTEDGQCKYKCDDGKYVDDKGECVVCNLDYCLLCSDDKCIKCDENHVLEEGKCKIKCGKGFIFNENSLECEKCMDNNCLICLKSRSTCEKCEENMILHQDICIEVCPDGTYFSNINNIKTCLPCPHDCYTCNSMKECEECPSGAYLFEGRCVDCPLTTYGSMISKTCEDCKTENCNKCKEEGSKCEECKYPMILYNNECINSCPDGTRLNERHERQRTCEECQVPNCINCKSSLSSCDLCEEGLFLYKDTCTKCPDKTYTDKDTQSCLPCEENCLKCKSEEDCKVCDKDYILYKNDCLDNCPEGFISILSISNEETDEKVRKCEKCEAVNCKQCQLNSTLKCKDCVEGMYLNKESHECEEICIEGTYKDSTSKTCEDCPDTCVSCISKSQCETCIEGMTLNNGRCTDTCPEGYVNKDNECKQCNTDESCVKCSNKNTSDCVECKEKMILFNKECIEKCPNGYFFSSNTCVECPSHCQQCNEESCLLCKKGYYLKEGECVSDCGDGYYNSNENCVECNEKCEKCEGEETCLLCKKGLLIMRTSTDSNNTFLCLEACLDGYFSNGNECLPCKSSNCIDCSNKTDCFKCLSPYFIENNSCVEACSEGYTLIENKCLPCSDPNCKACKDTQDNCILCKNGYLFINKCLPYCPKGYSQSKTNTCEECVNDCDNCQEDKSKCEKCTSPKVLLPNGSCVDKCDDGSIPVNGVCVECTIDKCSECYINSNECKTCKDGYFLTISNDCIEECSEGTYPIYSEKRCVPCSYNCKTCTDNNTCLSCHDNLIIIEGKCKSPCKVNGQTIEKGECVDCVDKNCKVCSVKETCVECEKGFFLSPLSSICINQCPDGYYLDIELSNCRKCSPFCQVCDSNGDCVECLGNKVLQNQSCIEKCFEGYVNVDGECEKCLVDDCKSCKSSDLSKCIICNEGLVLINNTCKPLCEEGFYVEDKGELGKECKECYANCNICLSYEKCVKCDYGFVLEDGACIKECKKGYTEINEECVKCNDKNCINCDFSQDICIICDNPYVNLDGQCKITCPNGYFKSESNECIQCSSNCLLCKDNNKCEVCSKDFVKFNSICIDKCPTGYVINTTNECIPCLDKSCQTCLSSDTSLCIDCNKEDFLYKNKCIGECPKGTFSIEFPIKTCVECHPSCKDCVDSNECRECKDLFYLEKGVCVQDCKSGEVRVGEECKKCNDENCLICNVSNECVSCKYPYLLYKGECIEKCPITTYSINSKCEDCADNCNSCKSKAECENCKENTVLFNGECRETCPNKYISDNGTCKKCDDDDCLKCFSSKPSTCYLCETKALNKGDCISTCPDSMFMCTKTKECFDCIENCLICNDQLKCESCKENYFLLHGKCVEVCPEGYVNSNKDCIKCGNDCKTCSQMSIDTCTSCKDERILYKGSCIDICPEGTYEDISKGVRICLLCSVLCKECVEKEDNCISCKGNQRLEDGKCVDTCPDGRVRINNECKRCTDSSCINCNPLNVDECYFCQEPKVVIEGLCVETCKPSQYFDEKSKQCIDCRLNCERCIDSTSECECMKGTVKMDNSNECVECKLPFQIINNQCKDCNALHCSQCQSGSIDKCEVCIGNYKNINGECMIDCPERTYNTGKECLPCIEDCVVCENGKECKVCDNNKRIYNNQCVDICPIGTKNVYGECKSCLDENCDDCILEDLSKCIKCKSNFILHNETCIEKCPNRHYFNKENETCVACLDSHCLSCNKHGCQVCDDGYYLNTSKICVISCSEGQKEVKTTKTCEDCKESLCISCSISTEDCEKCEEGFKLTVKGECKSSCDEGEFNRGDDICEKCSVGCEECVNKEECLVCLIPLKEFNGRCIQNCPDGYTESNGKCVPCDDNHCLKCEVNNKGSCIECTGNTYLYNGVCIEECPYGYFTNITEKTCEKCDETCEACLNKEECTQCVLGFEFNDGVCESTCPEGTYKDKEDKCRVCSDENCRKCKDEDVCYDCEDGFILEIIDEKSRCVIRCNEGFKEVNNKCEKCPVGCSECNVTECTKCNKTYYLQNGHCDYTCEEGTSQNCDKNVCEPCHPSCKTCIGGGSSQCLECSEGYVFLNEESETCVLESNCKEGYFPSKSTGQCEKCKQDNCKVCMNSRACQLCVDGYFSKDGLCLKSIQMKPIHLNSLLITPSFHNGEVSVSDEKTLFNTKTLSIWGVIESIGVGFSKEDKSQSLFFKYSSVLSGVTVLIGVERIGEDSKCFVSLQSSVISVPKVYKATGPSCNEYDLSSPTFIFSHISVDDIGNLSLQIEKVKNGISESSEMNYFQNTEIEKLGSFDSKIFITDKEMKGNQAFRVWKSYYSSSRLSSKAVIDISSLSNDYNNDYNNENNNDFTVCNDYKDKSSICSNDQIYKPITNGLVTPNTILNYNDSSLKVNNSLISSFIIETIIYESKGSLIKVFLNYKEKESLLNQDITIIEVKSDKQTLSISQSNGVIKVPIVTDEKWIRLIVKVNTSKEGIFYEVSFKNASTGSVFYKDSIFDNDKFSFKSKPKLTRDAFFISEVSLYGLYLHISNGKTGNFKEILPSLQEKTVNYHCQEFDVSANCIVCSSGYVLSPLGKCEDVNIVGCKEILDFTHVLNNEIKEIDIPYHIQLNKVNTFIIRARKIGYSHHFNGDSYSLISIRSKNSIIPIVKETFSNGKYILSVNGSQIGVYGSNFKGIFTISIQVNFGRKIEVSSSLDSITVSYEITNQISKLILGDVMNSQINTAFIMNLLCEKSLSTSDLSKVMSQEMRQKDASCIDHNYSSGVCKECLNGKTEKEECKQAYIGLRYLSIAGKKEYYTTLSNREVYVKDSLPTDVNSNLYLLIANLRLFNKFTTINDGEIEVIRLENDYTYNTQDTPSLIFSLRYRFSKGRIFIVIAYYDKSEVIDQYLINEEESVQYAIEFIVDEDRSLSKFKIHIKPEKGEEFEKTIPNQNLEKLESTARLTVLRPNSTESTENNEEIYLEAKDVYIIPNLKSNTKDLTIKEYFSNDLFKLKPKQSFSENEGCEYIDQNNRCLKCEEGKEIIKNNNICLSSTMIHTEERGYHLLTEEYVTSTVESKQISSPFGNEDLNLVCHLRINYVKYNSADRIIQLDDISIIVDENEGSFSLIFLLSERKDERIVLGPFTNEDLSDWTYFIISLSKEKYMISLRNSLTHELIDSKEGGFSSKIKIPERILVSNVDGSKSISNCHLLETSYQKAVVSYPSQSSVSCDYSIKNSCKASDFGVIDGKAKGILLKIENFVLKSGEKKEIKMGSLIKNSKNLCSREYSLTFKSSLLSSSHSSHSSHSSSQSYVTILKLNTGVNFIEIKQSSSINSKFSLEIKSYYTTLKLSSKKIILLDLPHHIENASIVFTLSINKKNQLDLLIYDTSINYLFHSLILDGVLDCLTSHSSIIFGEEAEKTQENQYLSIKNTSFEPESSKSKGEMFEFAFKLTRHVQLSCRISSSLTQTCTECHEDYRLLIDNNGKKGCAPQGTSFLYNLTKTMKITSLLQPVVSFTINESINTILLSISLSSPGSVEKVGMGTLSLSDGSEILRVYSEGSSVYIENIISNKTIELSGIFNYSKQKTDVTLFITIDITEGKTIVYAYDSFKEVVSTGSSFGNKSFPITSSSSLSIKLGYVIEDYEDFSFKAGTIILNINGKGTSLEEIKDLSVSQYLNQPQCKVGLSEDGFELCNEEFEKMIEVDESNRLFRRVSDIIPDYSNGNIIYKYSILINFDVENYLLSKGKNSNFNTIFAIDNNLSKDVIDDYKSNDILTEASEASSRLSINFIDDMLVVSTSKREIDVLDRSFDVSDYNKIKIILYINSEKGEIFIKAYADEVLIRSKAFAYELESISKESFIYKNQFVHAFLSLNENYLQLEKENCESFKVKTDHCLIENCVSCLNDIDGNMLCSQCSKEYYLSSNGECLRRTDVKNRSFIS